jgi:hypothetical protein
MAEAKSQIICLSKKELVPTKEFIVKSPAIEIGKTKENVSKGSLIFNKKSFSIVSRSKAQPILKYLFYR